MSKYRFEVTVTKGTRKVVGVQIWYDDRRVHICPYHLFTKWGAKRYARAWIKDDIASKFPKVVYTEEVPM